MPDLEESIAEWRRQMIAGGVESRPVLDELESHLREDVKKRERSGSSTPEAFRASVVRIGQAATLKSEFEKVDGTKGERRRRYLWKGSALGVGMFVAGISLGYFVVLPLIVPANAHYASWLGIEASQLRAMPYLSFVCKLLVGFGVAFALPVGLLTLVKIGVLDYQKLIRLRRYIIVFNLILAALLTTPEVVTQLLMFIPLQLIYEAGVWLAWYSRRKEMKCV